LKIFFEKTIDFSMFGCYREKYFIHSLRFFFGWGVGVERIVVDGKYFDLKKRLLFCGKQKGVLRLTEKCSLVDLSFPSTAKHPKQLNFFEENVLHQNKHGLRYKNIDEINQHHLSADQ
jgi:hypothetical protein